VSGTPRKDQRVLTPSGPAAKKPLGRPPVKKNDDLLAAIRAQATGEPVEMPPESQEEPIDNDFLKDLLWIYKQWGGRAQLLLEVRTDPDIRKLVLTTLLKSGALSPAAKRAAENKDGKGAVQKRGFLLVMKGLHDVATEEKEQSPLESVNPLKPDTVTQEPMVDTDIRDEEEIKVEGLDEESVEEPEPKSEDDDPVVGDDTGGDDGADVPAAQVEEKPSLSLLDRLRAEA